MPDRHRSPLVLALLAAGLALGACAGNAVLNGSATPVPQHCRRPESATREPPIVGFRLHTSDSLAAARSGVVGAFQALGLPITETSDYLILTRGWETSDLMVGGSRQRQIAVSIAPDTGRGAVVMVNAQQHNALRGLAGTSDTPLTSDDGGAGGAIWCVSQELADTLGVRLHATVEDVEGHR